MDPGKSSKIRLRVHLEFKIVGVGSFEIPPSAVNSLYSGITRYRSPVACRFSIRNRTVDRSSFRRVGADRVRYLCAYTDRASGFEPRSETFFADVYTKRRTRNARRPCKSLSRWSGRDNNLRLRCPGNVRRPSALSSIALVERFGSVSRHLKTYLAPFLVYNTRFDHTSSRLIDGCVCPSVVGRRRVGTV